MRLRVVHSCGHAHCFTFRGSADAAKKYAEKCKLAPCASCSQKEKKAKNVPTKPSRN